MVTSDVIPSLASANSRALQYLFDSDPVLIDVRPAIDVIPGMTRETILTSGAPLDPAQYIGGQRAGILGAAVYEGIAKSIEEAEQLLECGRIRVRGCHDYSTVGSVAGITSASMPVLVVEDRLTRQRGFCTLFEGAAPSRLNYGVYDKSVHENLDYLSAVVGPALSKVLRSIDNGVPLRPIMERALRQGDELHSRNTAASLLFLREVVPALLRLEASMARELVDYLTTGDYFFLRPSMAACKVMADAMHDTGGSSVVTAMAISCQEFSIRVAGLGTQWFRGQLPSLESCYLFPGFTDDDLEIMGGESIITEVCGLGAFSQAAAFPLQTYQGGDPQTMVARNLEMYQITAGEHQTFRIPFLQYRGSPVGIDVARVVQTRITPLMDVGLAGRGGGQVGAGAYRAPLQPFLDAFEALSKLDYVEKAP